MAQSFQRDLPIYPETVITQLPDGDRFRDDLYFLLMAGDLLRNAKPRVVYQCMTEASAAGDLYKALYFARLFTDLDPETAAGWTNRAKLASAVGFAVESEASRLQAEDPGIVRHVPLEPLPGQALSRRPSTLADWAAAVAVMADATYAREEDAPIIAVRDDLSGIIEPTQEEVEKSERGPWVRAAPIKLDHVLTNAFSLTDAMPMNETNVNSGDLAMGMLAAFAAGMGTATNDALSQERARLLEEEAKKRMASAYSVPSNYKGGHYTALTYSGNKSVHTRNEPKPSGRYEAIGYPVPILWAAGGSMWGSYFGKWANGASRRTFALRTRPSDLAGEAGKQKWRRYEIPQLFFPKLAAVCSPSGCSSPVTLMELMLREEDLNVLVPQNGWTPPDLRSFEAAYRRGNLELRPGNAAHGGFIGFDQNGVSYLMRHGPTQWLMRPESTASESKARNSK